MKLSQFDFELPQEKIATELMPEVNGHVQWRDECKLMVLHKDTGEIEHRQFKDIIDYFGKGDRFVLNDTKVFPAKLFGNKEKTGAEMEALTGVSVALLTIYDMCKAIDKNMEISQIRLEEKNGGKSGHYKRSQQ